MTWASPNLAEENRVTRGQINTNYTPGAAKPMSDSLKHLGGNLGLAAPKSGQGAFRVRWPGPDRGRPAKGC